VATNNGFFGQIVKFRCGAAQAGGTLDDGEEVCARSSKPGSTPFNSFLFLSSQSAVKQISAITN
jgi:hypothetical protein